MARPISRTRTSGSDRPTATNRTDDARDRGKFVRKYTARELSSDNPFLDGSFDELVGPLPPVISRDPEIQPFWARSSLGNNLDARNIASKTKSRLKFSYAKPEDYPDLAAFVTNRTGVSGSSYIEVGDLVLLETSALLYAKLQFAVEKATHDRINQSNQQYRDRLAKDGRQSERLHDDEEFVIDEDKEEFVTMADDSVDPSSDA